MMVAIINVLNKDSMVVLDAFISTTVFLRHAVLAKNLDHKATQALRHKM